jgi:proteasome accessory factor B
VATDRTERLLNLVICLLGARRPISRGALHDSIPGYSDAPSAEAFERMFERDKDELRQMGIPIDTVVNAQGEVEGYLIDHDAYAMPPVSLDAAELSVLGLAARMWSEAALAADAGVALRKIEATTGERVAPPEMMAGRPGSGEEHLPDMWEALRLRTAVRFDYLARGRDEVELRTVEPWATVYRGGAWYLVGLSRERGQGRAFRLSRIHGSVTRLREPCEAPSRDTLDAVVDGIAEPPGRGVARILLPERGGVRLRSRAREIEGGMWEVDFTDTSSLVSEAIEAGASIIAPDEAAALQREALVKVHSAHGPIHA